MYSFCVSLETFDVKEVTFNRSTSFKKKGLGSRNSVRNCFAAMLVGSERSIFCNTCAQQDIHVDVSLLPRAACERHTGGVLHLVLKTTRRWISPGVAEDTASAVAGERSLIPRTGATGCCLVLLTGVDKGVSR